MREYHGSLLTRTLLVAGSFLFSAGAASAEAIPVQLEKTDQGWRLLRDNEPYFIRGAGGGHSLEQLAAAGANSIRTWDADKVRGEDDVGVLLDEAHALGMTVTVGIWLGHERHGFDYSDAEQVAVQFQRATAIVERYKDHPAVLLWGIGNEMEGFDDGDNPAIWRAVNDIAAAVKKIDPNHPTMTVTTFVHGARIDFVHRHCPAIDIHGVNAYGAAAIVHEKLRAGKATKPFILTEFGPLGPWESATTEWGAPYEQTSTEKAGFYRQNYQEGVLKQTDLALGAYAFLWGHKMEATPTWFGMWLDDGSRLEAVDVMSELWSGHLTDLSAPTIEKLTIDGDPQLDPGQLLTARVIASDPDGDDLTARWALTRDSDDLLTGGDFRPEQPLIDEAIVESSTAAATVRMPPEPGHYRLFYYVFDGAGYAATANVPLRVKGEARVRLPFTIYEDRLENMPWVASGWMGNVDKLTLDGGSTEEIYSGKQSIKLRYGGLFGWVGVAWQNPPNNWGDVDGGLDLSGAAAVEVWARGKYGGEKVSFGVGLLDQTRAFSDSSISKTKDLVLTREWQRYIVSLKGKDLTSLKTGFVATLTGRQTPVTVYLDKIRFIP